MSNTHRGYRFSKAFGPLIAAAAAAAALFMPGAMPSAAAADAKPPIIVGIVTSTTGTFASQGQSFVNGFNAGLDYISRGTGTIDGHKIELRVANDNGNPAIGTAAARDLMGAGAKFLVGTTSSAVALPVSEIAIKNGGTYIAGASGTSELLAADRNIFITGSGSWMPNQAIFKEAGAAKKIGFIGQDYQFGQDQAALLKSLGLKVNIAVDSVLLPSQTQDFTGGVLRTKDMKTDMLYVGWQGNGTAQLYQALTDLGMFDSTRIVTALTSRATIPAFMAAAGPAASQTVILTSYFEGLGGGNKLETAMIDYAKKTKVMVDYVHPQGFTAALMIQRAIEKTAGKLDQPGVAKALEGWSFESPWGAVSIRPEDHLITVPIYSVRFAVSGDDVKATLLKAYPGSQLAPAVAKSLK